MKLWDIPFSEFTDATIDEKYDHVEKIRSEEEEFSMMLDEVFEVFEETTSDEIVEVS